MTNFFVSHICALFNSSQFLKVISSMLLSSTPMASMALIHWIRYLLRETSFYEKHYKQNVVPVPHYLLEEVIFVESFVQDV